MTRQFNQHLMLEREKSILNETFVYKSNRLSSTKLLPELLNKRTESTEKTDIWALGVMVYTMCVYKLPFQHEFEPMLKTND